jgi:hypothetical protein
VETVYALLGFIALLGGALYLLWSMPRVFRGHHEDNGPDIGGGVDSGGVHGGSH